MAGSGRRKAVFLDRDGVLNRVVLRDGQVGSPRSLEELEIVPDVRRSLEELREAGYLLVCVTNQPELPRGLVSSEAVEAMHQSIRQQLPLDDLLVCIHDDADRCTCRKPKPGMLLEAAARHSIALPASFMVGDRWRDVAAGRAAGCRTIFVDGGYEPVPEGTDFTVRSLAEAAAIIKAR